MANYDDESHKCGKNALASAVLFSQGECHFCKECEIGERSPSDPDDDSRSYGQYFSIYLTIIIVILPVYTNPLSILVSYFKSKLLMLFIRCGRS